MIPLAYTTTVAMARRAFDLSGDLRIDHDPLYESIFQLEVWQTELSGCCL